MNPNIILSTIGTYLWLILKTWWWAIVPLVLFFPVKALYLWWVRWEIWYKKIKWIVLEIRPPKEVLKPFRAMEDIFAVVWSIYDAPNWRERWCEGELLEGPFWASFEIVSIEGEIHFYIKVVEENRNLVESAIYAHYPDVEISLVDDYVKRVPQDAPNKEWDLLGEDYVLGDEDPYPIKTYEQFFEERPEVIKEEKRLDPLDSLMEELAKLGKGEQFWWQVVAAPILDSDVPWITQGKELANQIARRPAPPKLKSFLGQAAQEVTEGLILGAKKAEAPEKEKALPRAEEEEKELLLSPEERRVLSGVQRKISKRGFKTWIRAVYLYKRDVPWPTKHTIVRSYMNHFATEDLNFLRYWNATRTRIHYWWRKRRLFLRKRKVFKNYIRRLPPLYPKMSSRVAFPLNLSAYYKGRGWSILNTEELATIYHLPAKVTVLKPAIKPIEVKKGGPPPDLPTS